MQIKNIHSWDLSPKEAVALQRELAPQLLFPPLNKPVSLVAGADVSFSKGDPRIFGAVVVIRTKDMKVVETATAIDDNPFPYIPGFLAFREIPSLLKAFQALKTVPEAVICDGQGIAHPRGMGLASHLGLFLAVPTIGCAKSKLVGEYCEPDLNQWSQNPLIYQERTIGAVVRTRQNVKPVFVSPGHLIDLEGSIKVIRQCVGKYRLPEPTRLAHMTVNAYRKKCAS